MEKTFQKDFEDWKANYERFAIQDIRKVLELDHILEQIGNPEGNISVGLILLTFTAVESLSGYFAGQTANDTSRNGFMKEYFPPEYKTHINSIHLLRNSLAHDYALDTSPRISMFHYSQESHLQTCNTNGVSYLSFNRSRFAEDFLKVWEKYLTDLLGDKNLQNNWEKRANNPRGYLSIVSNPCSKTDWK